ncbi:MAG: hypothetical protein KY476_21890 [Planctomycetes bacterium]|nr:hypothetical protein [Planctomycetota bacterium]
MYSSISLLLVLNCAVQMRPADEGSPEFEQEQVDRWAKYYARQAGDYVFLVEGDTEQELTLLPEPVLRWSNPVTGNGTTHGGCFVWTHDGRPVVFASLFSYVSSRSKDQRVLAHAFNCLSTKPLVADRHGQRFWTPEKAGSELQEIADAPAVAAAEQARLVQMRNLARQFKATCDYGDNKHPLRLMPQPLYRYRSTSPEVTDGALFAFVTGTDPEMLLLIEARQTTDGPKWCFSAARHSHLTLRLNYREDEVWSYLRGGPHTRARDPKHHYFSVHGIEIRDAIIIEGDAAADRNRPRRPG